jgi:predicted GIY-YIG superfamily endonuclease
MSKPSGYWTFDTCKEEALKYNSRGEFKKKSMGCWDKSRKKGWLNSICTHMITIGNRYKKCIYVYEFSDNYAYVGLTYNINKRNGEHLSENDSPVFKHIQETNLTPILKQLTEYIDVEESIKLEETYLQEYKNNGWDILNIAKTGSIGGGIIKWNYDNCFEEALKYESRSDFKNGSIGAYESCLRNDWINIVCSHMISKQKQSGYWTFETCKEEALKYDSKSEFRKSASNCWNISRINMWLDDICKHMINKTYTFDECKEEALKYNSKTEFNKESRKIYNFSKKNNWLDDICSHFINNIIYSKEMCQEDALKYNSRSEFKKESSIIYRISVKYGWLEDICSHMISKQKPSGYWTKEKCQKEALKYNSKKEFKEKSNGAFYSSKRNNWLDDICSHMIIKQKPMGYWTYENCFDEAQKYKNRSEFKKLSNGAFDSSKRNNWLDEFFPKK